MKINKAVIKKLKPCADRFENLLKHCSEFNGTHEDFLELEEISHQDKLWVLLRLIPRFDGEVFAIDCAFNAYTVDAVAERKRQLDSICYLINENEKELI
jgi:hypothetical protein